MHMEQRAILALHQKIEYAAQSEDSHLDSRFYSKVNNNEKKIAQDTWFSHSSLMVNNVTMRTPE